MPRRFLKRVLPQRSAVGEQWFLRPFRALLNDPALWALHRRNVLRGTTVGIVSGFMPIPGQTILAGLLALFFRVNVPVALLASMISNPVTMGPLYYGAYRLGRLLVGRAPGSAAPELPSPGMWEHVGGVVLPLLLGCAIFAAVSAGAAWLIINWLWVSSNRRRLRQRAARRAASGGPQPTALEREDTVHPAGDREVVGNDHERGPERPIQL